ncbi:hypothetical protein [uncultured Jannaschia sp.]|uniref:hypothetical protein n=1 Tax=uncultured Jannaschia sp. TaxID=293347 RepID=UPI00260346FC|nr:hypothetical protein [uncultured Jannaschia sp.]
MTRIGLLPLARPTFDMPFAEEKLAAMLERLDAHGAALVGPRVPILDADAAAAALAEIVETGCDRLLILQLTFTDAGTAAAAAATGLPLSIWAVPEPRSGGRLRLNAFCGLNLASHALSLRGTAFAWAYGDPDGLPDDSLDALLDGTRLAGRLDGAPPAGPSDAPPRPFRIARIGAHPDGFDTCAYDPARLRALTGTEVDEIALATLFDTAGCVPEAETAGLRTRAGRELAGLDDVDAGELDRSLRLKAALSRLRTEGGYDAFAIRCWPECFTEYGGAVCGPVAMMAEDGTPCACEADVYGALSQLVLGEAAQAPVFLTDLVDMDAEDDSAVLWHCGQAPLSMRDPDAPARAAIHSNRRMPLLYQFPLKPGRVTLMRVSQSHDQPKMILAGAEMLARPLAFSGTSGVLRFDRPVASLLPDLIAAGTEHHMALAYGDHQPALRRRAAALGLPLLELT